MTCTPNPELVSQPPQCAPWWEVGTMPVLLIALGLVVLLYLGVLARRALLRYTL